MVTIVVLINLAIALILLYVAWQVWQLRLRLARITDTLTALERSTHAALYKAPDAIYLGQKGIHKLRQGKQPLALKILRVRQAVTLLTIGQQIWRRFILVRRSQLFRKGLAKYR